MAEIKLPEEVSLPDYQDSLLNLSNSILWHYGLNAEHSTLPAADEILARKYKHVVVILLDGLGMNILEKHLAPRDFLRRNLLTDYSSVFPPTTTAATTTFLSAKSPVEHGWLGWDVYFEQEDKTVTCFLNTLQDSDQQAAEYNVAQKYFPYETIIDQINKAGTAKASAVFPFAAYGSEPHPDLDDWVETIRKTCRQKDKTFTYAYWENPDHELHLKGTNSNDIAKIVQELNQKMADLCEDCPETAFFITADHGHTDIRNLFLQEDYPQLAGMLVRAPSIEPRAASFYVKPECLAEFPERFNKEFGQDYLLLTKNQALDMHLFGPGTPHENLTGLGDFIAIAYKDKTILWNKNSHQFKSHHAGLSRDEMEIPLITYENRPRHIGMIFYYIFIAALILYLFIALF